MKLAQALILRADCLKRLEQLKTRLERSALVQQDDTPPENPRLLLEELDRLIAEFVSLVQRINRTNVATQFADGQTLADALAVRDSLLLKRKALSALAESAVIRINRYSGSEVRYMSTVDVAVIQQQMDALSREHRELDARIQATNWQIDLLD